MILGALAPALAVAGCKCEDQGKADLGPRSDAGGWTAPGPDARPPAQSAAPADAGLEGADRIVELAGGFRLEIQRRRITAFRGEAVQSELDLKNPILTVDASPREPVIAIVTGTSDGAIGVRFVFLENNYSKNINIMDLSSSYLGGSIWSPDGEYVAVTGGEVL